MGAVLDLFVYCVSASFLLPLPLPFLDLHVWHHHKLKALGPARLGALCPFQASRQAREERDRARTNGGVSFVPRRMLPGVRGFS